MLKINILTILVTSFAMGGQPNRQPAALFDFLRRADPAIDVMKCKECSVPFSDENWVQLEKIEKCSAERRFLQDDVMKIDPDFRNKRASNQGQQFPLACVVHAQRTFTWKTKEKPEDAEPTKWSGYEVPSRSMGQCADPNGEPVRFQYLPCVTSEYAYSVYNAFSDMVDCFDIEGKKLLPKLWNESGFHIITLGGGLDGGVGQMTKSALQEVLSKPFSGDERTALEIYRDLAANSTKASCQRLIKQPKSFEAVSVEPANRCSIMSTPENPVRNVIYLGVFYKLNERMVTNRMQTTEMQKKVEELGLSNADMEFFRDAIVTLSFNAGRGQAFSLIETYLKSRITNKKKLTKKDLDFVNTSIEEVRQIRKEPKDEDEDGRKNRIERITKARDKAHERNLPSYLRLMHGLQADFETEPDKKRINGAPGYLTFVGERTKKFDNELGEGLCTKKSFLQYK